jgi:hypothetical protein
VRPQVLYSIFWWVAAYIRCLEAQTSRRQQPKRLLVLSSPIHEAAGQELEPRAQGIASQASRPELVIPRRTTIVILMFSWEDHETTGMARSIARKLSPSEEHGIQTQSFSCLTGAKSGLNRCRGSPFMIAVSARRSEAAASPDSHKPFLPVDVIDLALQACAESAGPRHASSGYTA